MDLAALWRTVQELSKEVSQLQADVAALQANVVWLTRYVWVLIAANATSLVASGVLIRRGNNKKQS